MPFDVPGINNRADIFSLLIIVVAVSVLGQTAVAVVTGSSVPSQPLPAPDGVGPAAWAVVPGVAHLLVGIAVNSEPYHLLFDESLPRTGAQAIALFVVLMLGLLVYA